MSKPNPFIIYNFWDNVDFMLFEEFKRQKLMYRFKQSLIKKQMKYN
jgi:hypothetical protein